MNLDSSLTYIISGTLLIMVALITTFKRKGDDQNANFYLAAYFWSYTIAVFISVAVLKDLVRSWPHIYRLAQIPGLAIMPLSYLYVARKLYGKRLKKADLLHLLPLAIYLVDYAPFFLLSSEKKLALYLMEAANPVRLKLAYAEGWFMPDFGHTIIRYLVWLGYWIGEVILIRRAMRNPSHPLPNLEPRNWQWLQLLVASQVLIFAPPLVAAIIGSEKALGNWINVAAMMASSVQCYYLIFRPEVLYSLDTELIEPATATRFTHENPPSSESENQTIDAKDSLLEGEIDDTINADGYKFLLSEEALDQVEETISAIMDSQKPFVKARYTIRELAADSGIAAHRISVYLNRRCGLNFYGYLNDYRIKHFLSKIENREHKTKTLEAIAQECGFQSRATFVRAFKNHTGQTPSQFAASAR